MRNPTVSVIMPTYNQADTIGLTVRSILRQTFTDFELIVVSDGAGEETDRAMLMFSDARIKYKILDHGNDFGIGALNYGMELAQGDYLTFISSDNLYFSPFLRTLLETIDETGADFSFGDFLAYEKETGLWIEFERPPHLSGQFALEHLAVGYTIGICFLFTRDIFEAVKPYIVSPHADYDMAARMAIAGAAFHHVPAVLGVNAIHEKQLSVTSRSQKDETKTRLMVVEHLIKIGHPGAKEFKEKAERMKKLTKGG